MPTIPQRIASAFAVLRGRYGDVTEMAKDREQSRQSLYREAYNKVRSKFYRNAQPTSTLVVVKALGHEDFLIEIDGIAVI